MKEKFVLATKKDTNIMYNMWGVFSKGMRIFGLKESIANNFVYIFRYRGKIRGFVRFDLTGKTTDYLKFNEICCIANDIVVFRSFFRELDVLVFKLGYIKMEIVADRNMRDFILVNDDWDVDGMKFITSKKNRVNRVYGKSILTKNIYDVNKQYFGNLLIKYKV